MEAFLVSPGVSGRRSGASVSSFTRSANAVRVSRKRVSVQVRMNMDTGSVDSLMQELTKLHDSVVASTILMADAAAPTVDAVAAPDKPGLWGSLVKLIESSIQNIHDFLAGGGVPYSYGFAIIAFTVIVKAVTLPLNVKQMESTMRMQEVQPRIKQIQTEYKDNPNVMNQRLAGLYKDENINPLAGCLPVLAQTPIWIALYRAVLNMSKDNLLDESFLWVPSLQGPVAQGGSIKDWLFPFVNGAPPVGWHDAVCYMIFPVVLIATQSYSQKVLTPPTQDPQTQQANQILKFLPFMLGWFSLTVPSGLTVYWVTNNVLSTAQTIVLRKRFNANSDTAGSDTTVDVEARPTQQLKEVDGFSGSSSKGSKKKSKKRRK